MKRFGILGGGISGLSTAYYILLKNPKANIVLFDGSPVGGWINTSFTNDYFFENGPRSFRIGPKAVPLLALCEKIGISKDLIYSVTNRADSQLYNGKELINILPKGRFRMLKMMLGSPVYRRFIINNFLPFRRKKIDPSTEDLSIREFLEQAFHFSRAEDQQFFIDVLTDAFVQGIFSGDISKLSARFCYPFSVLYENHVLEKFERETVNYKDDLTPEVQSILAKAVSSQSSSMNFKGGMGVLTNSLFNFIQNYPGFSFVPEDALRVSVDLNKPTVHTQSSSYECDHIISTIPSFALSPVIKDLSPELSKICDEIPHNSLKTVSLGFESLGLKGIGFLVPTMYQKGLAGCLYDSYSFPYLKPCVSLMGSVDASEDKMIEEFRKITGCTEKVLFKKVSVCKNGLPQYQKGHIRLVEWAEASQPSWLSISGQSFYLSGVPNCVIRAQSLVKSRKDLF